MKNSFTRGLSSGKSKEKHNALRARPPFRFCMQIYMNLLKYATGGSGFTY